MNAGGQRRRLVPSVDLDSSVFLAILKADPSEQYAGSIQGLFAELSQSRTIVQTSILTIQECSVSFALNHSDPRKALDLIDSIARVQSITEEIALASASLEARMRSHATDRGASIPEDNRRRKWDCFHLATALEFKCHTLYAIDSHLSRIVANLSLPIKASLPKPNNPTLFQA